MWVGQVVVKQPHHWLDFGMDNTGGGYCGYSGGGYGYSGGCDVVL